MSIFLKAKHAYEGRHSNTFAEMLEELEKFLKSSVWEQSLDLLKATSESIEIVKLPENVGEVKALIITKNGFVIDTEEHSQDGDFANAQKVSAEAALEFIVLRSKEYRELSSSGLVKLISERLTKYAERVLKECEERSSMTASHSRHNQYKEGAEQINRFLKKEPVQQYLAELGDRCEVLEIFRAGEGLNVVLGKDGVKPDPYKAARLMMERGTHLKQNQTIGDWLESTPIEELGKAVRMPF